MEQQRRALEEGVNGLTKQPQPLLFTAAGKEHLALKAFKWKRALDVSNPRMSSICRQRFGGFCS
jgi:hypothetical protein